MPKYKVRDGEHIMHDGKEYKAGDVLTCTEEQAKVLRIDAVSEKKKLSAEEAIVAINACETIDQVKAFFKDEERPTVIQAAKAKIAAVKDALKAAENK